MKYSHEDHCRYMRRCLQLRHYVAVTYRLTLWVGAVVVHKGRLSEKGIIAGAEKHMPKSMPFVRSKMKSCLENLQSMFRSNLVLIMGKHLRAAN